jgi:hypothetical protein
MKPLVLFLSASTLASVIALAWMMSRPDVAEARVASLEAELKSARQTIDQLRKELAAKPVAPVATPSSASPATPVAANAPATETPAAAAPGSTPSALRSMLKDPAMRDLLSRQQAVQVETSYAGLMEYLKLNDEERAHFKKLLLERAKLEADMGLKLLDANVTPAEREKIIAEAEKGKKAYDETIRAFLNDEGDWKAFQNWENTRPERTQYELMGRSLFSSSGEPLNAQQENQLIQLMAQSRQSPSPDQQALLQRLKNPTQMNESNIKAFLDYQRSIHEATLRQAASFLSEGQMRSLKTYLDQQLSTAETGYRMGGLLMQGRGSN